MSEIKVVELQVKTNLDESTKSIGTLKQQLKAAKAEVLALSDEFGVTSQQAIHAAEKAAELGHEISAANKLVKTFNPSATLNSTTLALGSVKEGFEVAGSTMKAFGVESTQLEGALGKVGVAMELTSGVTAIQESAGAFKNLGATLKSYSIVQKVITAGQWLWNAAITANPIGALVLAIGAVISAGFALTKYFMDNAVASHKNEEAIKENSKALNEQIKIANKNTEAIDINSKQKLAMAKASGKSAEEIRNLELKLIDEKIAFEKSSREIAKNTYYKNLNALATLKSADADEEQIKNQTEVTKLSLDEFSKQNKNLNEAVKEKAAIINRHLVEVKTDETKNNEDAKKTRYENNKEELQDALTNTELSFKQKRDLIKNNNLLDANDRKDFLKQINKEEVENTKKIQVEKLEQERAFAKEIREIQIAAGYKAQDDVEAAKKANADMLLTEQQLAIKNENDAYKLKYDNAVKNGFDIEELETAHWNTLNNINLTTQQKQYTEEEKIAQSKLDQKIAIKKAEEDLLMGGLSTLKTIFGKNKEIQKGILLAENGIALAKLTMNTIESVSKDNAASPLTFGMPWAGVHIGQGVLGAANIISSTSKGLAALGGGSAGSSPSMGSSTGAAPAAPQFNVVGASGQNQIAGAIGNQSQQPIQAYVVAGAVSTAQSLNRNIISNASMG